MYDGFTSHPKDFLWYVLLWEGARARAVELGTEMANSAASMMMMGDPNADDGAATYLPFTYVRFGMWTEALALPEPKGPASGVATHLARGLALAATGKLDDALKEPDLIRKAAVPPPDPPNTTNTTTGPPPEYKQRRDDFRRLTADSAALQVTAAVAEARGDHGAASAALRQAVTDEDQAPPLGEPPAWPLSARQRLGAVLVASGQAKEAAAVYREDLRRHPHNGWALFGLATALDALHDPAAKATWQEFHAAWARSNVTLRASSF
jgi:tetratricopeptide (TPR) repeat protein